MTRAEKRRKAKETLKGKVRYNVTREQLDKLIHEEIAKILPDIEAEIRDSAMTEGFINGLTVPLEVLRRSYWKKSFPQKVKNFIEEVISLFNEWQDSGYSEEYLESMKEMLWEYGGIRLQKD